MENLNRKKFKGEYYNAIENGIKTAFGNLYPNNEVTVKYFGDRDCYYFNVYINGETFAQQELPMVVNTLIYVDKYSNTQAISLFSSISKEKYDAEYNNYSDNNYTWLRNELDKVINEAKVRGVIFVDVKLTNSNWRLECFHPEKSKKKAYKTFYDVGPYSDYSTSSGGGYFAIQPISTSTAKSTLSKMKGVIKRCLSDK